MQQRIITEKTANGVEIVIEEIPLLRSVTVGFWLKNGSRNEDVKQAGLSHFIEHLVFKGSEFSTCQEIATKIDSLGGNVDAFTSREFTSFVVKVLDSKFKDALALLSEVVFHPSLLDDEIELEKDVILEEIKMVQDTPDDLIHELFFESMFGSHPLGRSILGSVESISGFNRKKIRSFFSEYYRPDQLLVAVAGNVRSGEVLKAVDEFLGALKPRDMNSKVQPPSIIPCVKVVERENLEQVHLLLGVKTFSIQDDRRHSIEVLNAHLGGSISSRLFQQVREKLGLAYSINSFVSAYSDTGFLGIYAATSPDRVEQLVDVVRKELNSLAQGNFTGTEIERVKSMIKADAVLGMESSASRMGLLARQQLYFGHIKSLDDLIEEMESVKYEEVVTLAGEIFKKAQMTAAAIGNLKNRHPNFERLEG